MSNTQYDTHINNAFDAAIRFIHQHHTSYSPPAFKRAMQDVANREISGIIHTEFQPVYDTLITAYQDRQIAALPEDVHIYQSPFNKHTDLEDITDVLSGLVDNDIGYTDEEYAENMIQERIEMFQNNSISQAHSEVIIVKLMLTHIRGILRHSYDLVDAKINDM